LSWGAFMRVLADGRRALSESRDKTLRLWDLETGAEISCLTFDAVPSTLAWSERMEVAVVRDGLGLMHFVELAGWTPVDVPEH
jgi:WD40 repeat protein